MPLAFDLLQACRRGRTRWLGTGPWRALPWTEVLALRQPACALHEPETTTGEIATLTFPAVAYAPAHPLLGQIAPPLRLESGDPRYREGGVSPAATVRFWSLDDAGVIGEDGLVYCPQCRAAVAETARQIFLTAGQHPALAHDQPVTARLAGISLLLTGPFGHAHYHLLWDYLAKLALLPADVRQAVDHYLIGVPETPRARDWLAAAGVPLARVVWLSPGAHLRCEQVIFGSLPCGVNQPRAEVQRALCGLLGPAGSTEAPRRWLWISRRGQPERDLRWEDQLLAALPRFERLALESLTAHEQMAAFAEAAVIAGPHGSGLASLAFVRGSGHLVEFFSPAQPNNPLYGRLAQVAGWRAHWARVDFTRPTELAPVIAALGKHLPPP